ncbi:hypothetical protein GCM10027446_18370 [Angustibacter peucedani]
MNAHELLDQVASDAVGGRRVHVDDVRAVLRRRRLRRVRVVAAVAACLLVAVPVAAIAVAQSRLSGLAQPASPSGRTGPGVVPDRLPVLHTAPPALVDADGTVRAQRLSMAFVGTMAGQEGAYGMDGDTGRVLRLPVLGESLRGLPPLPTDGSISSVVLAAVSLSPDGRTVAVAYRGARTAYNLVLDLATGRATSYVQTVPDGVDGSKVLAIAAADDGRFVVPNADLTGVRVLSVDGSSTREVAIDGLDAEQGVVLDAQPGGVVVLSATQGSLSAQTVLPGYVPNPLSRGKSPEVQFSLPAGTWSASQLDASGSFVTYLGASGQIVVRGTLGTNAGQTAAPKPSPSLRVVSAIGGHVLVVDDGRQKVPQLVDVAKARTLSEVMPDGTLRPITRLTDADGNGRNAFVVAQQVVSGAQVVPAKDDPWYVRRDVQLWFVGLAALVLLGVAMIPRGHRPR